MRIILTFIFLPFLIFASVRSYSSYHTTSTVILNHIENSNCYEVETTVTWTSDDNLTYLVSRGTAWIGSDCDRLGYGCNLAANNCPSFVKDGRTFCASDRHRECLETAFQNPAIWSAYLALEAELLQRIEGAGQPRGLVNHAKSGMIQLSPNPANGFTLIKVDGRQLTEDATLRIYDLTGKVQFTALCRAGLQPVISLMLNDFAAGRYEVVLDSKGVIKAKDVLIIH